MRRSSLRRARLQSRFAAAAPDLWRGLRAGLATVVPFYLAHEWARPELGFVAIGGWLGSMVDAGGSRGERAFLVGSFAVAGGASVAVAASLHEHPLLSVLYLTGLAWLSSQLRAVGGSASSWGTILLISTAIACGGSSVHGPMDGLYFAAGSCWAVVLSSIVWPIWTHLPLRRAVAEVLARLGHYSEALLEAARAETPPSDARWSEIARSEQRAVRDALETARCVALTLRGRRSGETALGSRLRVLLGDAEAQFAGLVSTAEELEQSPEKRRVLSAALIDFARGLAEARVRLLSEAFFERREPKTDEARLSRRLISAPSWSTWDVEEAEEVPSLGEALVEKWHLWRDAWSLESPFLVHAHRVALATCAAAALGTWVSKEHVTWVTVTTIAVLQPYPGATVRRAVERVIGTVFGCLLAVVLLRTVHDPLALSVCLIPLSAAAVLTRPRSYRLFTFFLTPVFLLFATPGNTAWSNSLWRSADAMLGGLVALLAATLITPSWERERIFDALDRVLSELSLYADMVLGGDRDKARTAALRRRVGVALGEAETSFERMLAEPLHDEDEAERALLLLTYCRRLTNALTAFHHGRFEKSPVSNELRERQLSRTRHVLAELRHTAVRTGDDAAEPHDLPDGLEPAFVAALGRIARYDELLGRLALRRDDEGPEPSAA